MWNEGGIFIDLIWFSLFILTIAGYWYVFEKSGKSGWKAVIPVYNLLVLLQIVKKPWWWIFLLIIPFVNIFFYAIVLYRLARSFGKSGWFALGIFFIPFIFVPILGFDESAFNIDAIEDDRT